MEKKSTRRTFLATAGAAAAGVAFAGPALRVLASGAASTEGTEATRYAMVVDLSKCRQNDGCTDCKAACDRIHNVPQIDSKKEEIKWIWKEQYEKAFPMQENEFLDESIRTLPVPVLCNHCVNPPCVKVCPTQATFKREDGIVTMDMHRCIGCRYCIVACPYGSRSFNWSEPWPDRSAVPNADYPTRMRGVVEKCSFCEELLAEGEPPACVSACEAGALTFGDLSDPGSEVRRLLKRAFSFRRKPSLGTGPNVYYLGTQA